VGVSVQQRSCAGEQAGPTRLDDLAVFRCAFYDCLTLRADALFELADAVLCAEGPVSTLVGLTLTAEHRRGHGALYDGLGSGRIQVERLRRSLATLPVPRDGHGRITLAVDISPWLRPDAATSPDRSFCHVYGRGKSRAQMIPGWPYSFVAALEPGRTSWTALLDVVRLGPDDDATTVTATQLREVVQRLQQAGQHKPGDADILIVFDAGYDVTRLAFLLADLPVELLGRLRSDRVFYSPPPPRAPSTTGRPSKHGPEFALAQTATQPEPNAITVTDTSRYGTARACAWNWLHPRLTHRAAWESHDGPLPLIEGSIIRLQVDRLPGDRNPKPVWLWYSRPELNNSDVNRLWRAFLRRFDLEHTLPVPQANPGLDPTAHPHPRTGPPLDLAHRGRPHPTPTGTPPHQRSASTMGETNHPASPAHPRPHPPRVSKPPTQDHPASQRTKTLTTRTRPPTRINKQAARSPPRRRQKQPNPKRAGTHGLNDKLSGGRRVNAQ
jgi:hypothetical protein